MVLRGSNINPKKENETFLFRLLAGGSAGAIARSVVAPIDRVKILLQTSYLREEKAASIREAVRIVHSEKGWKSFWKGNATNCSRVIPHTATQFTAYPSFKELIAADPQDPTGFERLLSGACAGATAATLTHPLDVMRIRLQTEKGIHSVQGAFSDILKEGKGSPRYFYKGYGPTIASLGPFIGINFATFDFLSSNVRILEDKKASKGLVLGGASGLVAQSICYPLDTIRRRMQISGSHYSSWLEALSVTLKNEGVRGFYRGFAANALKVVPNNGIRFGIFEFLRGFYKTS